jgi:hypothetical protein
MDLRICAPPNSCVESLTLTVMAFEIGSLGGTKVEMRS